MEIQFVGMSNSNYFQTQETLTDEQKAKLEEILAKYDPENLSDEDRKAMMDDMRDADIPRCRETFQMLKESGFQPPKPPAGQMMPDFGEQASASSETDERSELMELIEQLKTGAISEESFMNQLQLWGHAFSATSGNLIDQSI